MTRTFAPVPDHFEVASDFGVFRCPSCHADLDSESCSRCGLTTKMIEGIPLLVRDRVAIEDSITAAKAEGRAHWYEMDQDTQWSGPYRHHLRKRRAFVDRILTEYRQKALRQLTGLDLGCGDGTHLEWLSGHIDSLYASDYNIGRLVRAQARGKARRVFMADITDYPARDGVFDVIYFNHVLEHIADDETALAEIHRILKPGGLLILGVPNEGAWFWRMAYWLQPKARSLSDHVHFYTAESIAAKCRAAGFIVRHTEHLGYGVPHWGLDARLRQYKFFDDAFDAIGRITFPAQATSLYLILTKAAA